MKHLIWCIALVALPGTVPVPPSAPPSSCAVTVHVFGFQNDTGHLRLAVFSSPDGWPHANGKAFFEHEYPIQGDEATVQLTLPLGRYAIAVLHDGFESQKPHRKFKRAPTKGFGFSDPLSLLF